MDISFSKINICEQPCLQSSNLRKDTKIIFIVIPGNPSIVEYYQEFSQKLINIFNYPVIISSLHQNKSKYLSINKAISLKTKFFIRVYDEYPNSKFIIFAHSIGNYIGLNALNSLDQRRIIGYYALFPALINLYSSFSKLYKFISCSPIIIYLISYSTYFYRMMPLCLFILLFKLFSDIPSNYLPIIKNHADFYLTAQMLSLTKEEGLYVKEYKNEFIEYLNSLDSKLHFIYGKNDVYGNEKVAEDMKKRCKNAKIVVVDILHAFVLGHADEVIRAISGMIKESI